MIAVHGGVGFRCERLLSTACADALRDGKEDVISTVSALEDNPLFNCGYGSNPTITGTVECEAGFMSSDHLRFGAVGAVSRLQNPCQVAKAIAFADNHKGLVSPMVLVGSGAEEWAEEKGFMLRDAETMVAPQAVQAWRKARSAIDQIGHLDGLKMDTVGAVSIEEDVVEACTSSGGIMLKSPGRLGHCAIYGSGMWAERRGNKSIGVTVSGCGEAVSRANFSRSLADRLLNKNPDELTSSVVHSFFENEFLRTNLMSPLTPSRLYAGGLVLLQEDDGLNELIVFHNTPVLPFAYRQGSVIRKSLSKLPTGSNILVESYPLR
ncbi:asparaginase [Cooperia oncophora]